VNVSDCPQRCRVRVIDVYEGDPPVKTGTTTVPADRVYVGFALVQGTRRKFYIALDDVVGHDDFFSLPEGTDPGPEIGVMCKVDRQGDFVCGGYDEDGETPREGFRRHGIRLHRALLVKWYQAGVLHNPT